MAVVTVTVNQWHIKHNAENPDDPKPVVCINRYEDVHVSIEMGRVKREWGDKIGETEHYFDFTTYEAPMHVIYDPVNKTPCGASCWMEYEE